MTTQARHRGRIGSRIGNGVQNAIILVVMILSIAPFLWVASNSVKPRSLIYEYPPRLVFTPTSSTTSMFSSTSSSRTISATP